MSTPGAAVGSELASPESARPRQGDTPPDVRLENVTKRFDDVVAVDDLSLDR